jgi:hypothetical protein
MEVKMKNERLERLSDDVRRGFPVGFSEAIEVIEYQDQLNTQRKMTLWRRFRGLFIS